MISTKKLFFTAVSVLAFAACSKSNSDNSLTPLQSRLNTMNTHILMKEGGSTGDADTTLSANCKISVESDALQERIQLHASVAKADSTCPMADGDTLTFDCNDNMICNDAKIYGDPTTTKTHTYQLILVNDGTMTLVVNTTASGSTQSTSQEFSFDD